MAAIRIAPSEPCTRVAVIGGTHGNERNGVHLVQLLAQADQAALLSARCPSLVLTPLIANVAASTVSEQGHVGRRFCEEDMNRCFSLAKLRDESCQTLEAVRAREVAAVVGPKGTREAQDFIFDRTTAP